MACAIIRDHVVLRLDTPFERLPRLKWSHELILLMPNSPKPAIEHDGNESGVTDIANRFA